MSAPARIWLAIFLLFAAAAPISAASPVEVQLELGQEFYYAGDPLTVRISVRNPSHATVANPVKLPLLKGFKIRSGNENLSAKGKANVAEPTRPAELTPSAFYGGLVNLVDLYPALAEPGRYEIYWSGNGIVSSTLVVTVIPRFDPGKRYGARIETNFGMIEIEFNQDEAPIAAKAFVDMANAGYYDGLLFHEVQTDSYVMGGDGRFADPPRRSIRFPAEQSVLPLVAGSVVMKPIGAAPPANGSTFVIVLRTQPRWAGQVTVVGQVVKGLDIVRDISRVPTTGEQARPQFKPLRDVTIKRVVVVERRANATR